MLPPAGAIRIEELVNYFRFDYPQPSANEPFSITTELAPCPWNPRHRLALIGLQGRELKDREPPPRNLVFLIDVSGSMMPPDKLPLVRTAMRMLTDVLTERDRVAIVVYAGASGLVLPSTTGEHKDRIHQALAHLEAGGSTNGAAGIRLAYRVARDNFIDGGVNRVILATDGDFNVGVTNQSELVSLIEARARERRLPVGARLRDGQPEGLDDGEAGGQGQRQLLRTSTRCTKRGRCSCAEAGATLVTVAKDVKIQVEFNPRAVAAYRLIGYENRLLRNEDFNDDKKDAGEIGAGHRSRRSTRSSRSVRTVEAADVDPLKYQRDDATTRPRASGELMTVKVRYKAPDGDTSQLLTRVVINRPHRCQRMWDSHPQSLNSAWCCAVHPIAEMPASRLLWRGHVDSAVATTRAIAASSSCLPSARRCCAIVTARYGRDADSSVFSWPERSGRQTRCHFAGCVRCCAR